MAPMVTDSYLNFNSSDFGNTKQNNTQANNKPPLPSHMSSYNADIQSNKQRGTYNSEDQIIELLKGNNYKQQAELFEDLIAQASTNTTNDSLFLTSLRNINEFHSVLGYLLINTINNDVQRHCLKFLQLYLKQVDKLKIKKKTTNNSELNNKFKELDKSLCGHLLEYLMTASVSSKLQLKQISIDLIYSCMKLTENLASYFDKFIHNGIENSDLSYAKIFIETTLCILLQDEFENQDFSHLMRSLIKQLTNAKLESSVMKCLSKIEMILKYDKFQLTLNKLPLNLKTLYLNTKNNSNNSVNISFNDFNGNSTYDEVTTTFSKQMKFNLIRDEIVKKLAGEDEIQRLQAIRDLEQSIKLIKDIKTVYPYYQDFITYMNNFVDDSNYEIRLASLKILSLFIEKLDTNVNQCYKAICNCARQVMSQTHQSKTVKQALNTMLLLTIENMSNPVLFLECLLDRIKDRSAKAREEFLNIIITAVLKFPSDKFESLRKVFFQVVPLLCDIKRNVRHAALECIAILFNKIKQVDRNAANLLEQLEHVPDFHDADNVQLIREVILFRLKRNTLPKLNSDMTIEYGVKIPTNGLLLTNSEIDIEWVVSASSSSASASNLSSARSQKSLYSDISTVSNNVNFNKMLSLNDKNKSISTGSFRRAAINSGGNKKMPWDELTTEAQINNTSVPKVMRSREVAPLKAFPLHDEFDFINTNMFNADFLPTARNGYPSSTSYQEKYLKKIQGDSNNKSAFNSISKTDSHFDLNDISDTVKRVQSEKAYSLDNLYNLDDNINSQNNIQKRKYANINLKNGIIPSKPTIPRRNSATKTNNNSDNSILITNNNNNSYLSTNRSSNTYDFDDDYLSNQYSTDDFSIASKDLDSSNKNKYDTVPNLRTSAKNRKKLEKIFSLGANTNSNNNTSSNKNSLINNDTLDYVNKTKKFTSSNSEENNLYLNKLKADTMNGVNLTSSRYSPSNPESGIFSINDYDQIDSSNRFIRQQNLAEAAQLAAKKQQNTNKQPTTTNNASNKADVEIVGFKLGNANNSYQDSNNNNYQQLHGTNVKKKNSIKGLSEGPLSNELDSDALDIVGKGYNNSQADSYQENYEDFTIEEADFPLSLSFKSRLRQKTQEKIEEKQKKRVEKIKREKQKKELDTLNTNLVNNGNTSPLPGDYTNGQNQNFGLSISGYQNQLNNNNYLSSKPPIYNQQSDHQKIYTLDNFQPNPSNTNRQLQSNENQDYDLSNVDYMTNGDPNEYGNTTTLPSLDKPKFKPTNATQARLKAKAAAAATSNTTGNNDEKINEKNRESEINDVNGVYGTVREEFIKQPFKNPENAFKEAMNYLSQEDWEKKCQAMNIIRRLSVYHEDLTVNNIHAIVLALLQEVKNLRSQVSRFALLTFGDLFTNLKRYMDVDLDIAVKTILQKNGETSDFIRSDVEKCLEKMVNNVTTHKGLIALVNGGASHRNPLVRRTTAQYIYKCCEIMGPGKILSGIKDVTERILITASQFVVDGPVDIRWYGRKIFHMLMSHDEFDRLLVKCLNENTRKNIKEILDTIRVKGPGDVPTESARNARKSVRNTDSISRSAGSNINGTNISLNPRSGSNSTFNNENSIHEASSSNTSTTHGQAKSSQPNANVSSGIRLDAQAQEYVRSLCVQLRNPDFRERIDAIEKFQVLCETQTEIVIVNIVQLFDKFNPCLTDSNSKANYKALNTMCQIVPILGDNLNAVIANVVPLVAQNLASKNSEIQDMAANILDVFVDYLDGGVLVQPFTNIAQHGNVRIRPQIIYKLADLVPLVYSRKQKQIELHVLPTLWSLLNSVKGSTGNSSSSALNSAIAKLAQNLNEQMNDQLLERASNSSAVSARNLDLLKELLMN